MVIVSKLLPIKSKSPKMITCTLNGLPMSKYLESCLMTTPRPYHKYSPVFKRILEKARDQDQLLYFKSKRLAENARRQFYAFRTAAANDIEQSQRVALIAPLIRTRIEDTTLIIYYPSHLREKQNDSE